MTASKTETGYVFTCDCCGRSDVTMEEDFHDAYEIIKSEGWLAHRLTKPRRNRRGENVSVVYWKHSCSDDCRADMEIAQ